MGIFHRLAPLGRDEQGVTALEYGLIAALIAAATVGALDLASTNFNATFAYLGATLSNAVAADPAAPAGK